MVSMMVHAYRRGLLYLYLSYEVISGPRLRDVGTQSTLLHAYILKVRARAGGDGNKQSDHEKIQ